MSGGRYPGPFWPLFFDSYLGRNCEFGTGAARLAVGALRVNPITAQLILTPEAP